MRATNSAWLAVVVSILNVPVSRAQAPPSVELLAAKTHDLQGRLCGNVKVVGSVIEYDTSVLGKYLSQCDFTLVSGQTVSLYKGVERVKPADPGLALGWYRSRDMLCSVPFNTKTGKFTVQWTIVPWGSQNESIGFTKSGINNMRTGYAIEEAGIILADSGNNYYPDAHERLPGTLSVKPGNLRGRACVVVAGKKTMGGVSVDITSYLDPVHYCVLEKEKSHKFDFLAKKTVPVREVMKIDYSSSVAGAPPFPKRVQINYVEPVGTTHKRLDLTYTTYEKYTPTAEELDFKTQFGIDPPSVPPRPPLPPPGQYLREAAAARPGWPTWWLYAGAGALAVLAATVVTYARRRRSRNTPAPSA